MESTLRDGADTPGLKLIETMLWDGACVPRWPLHVARLTAGAVALGWAVPALSVAGPAGQAARLRLTLDCAGVVEVEVGAVPPALGQWRLGLAAERLFSGDPWLGVKSTRRAVYDRARAGLPAGLDELVFLNERGEVCDGTITTLFFDRGAGVRTPPLRSGLLPGVLRAETGCPEEVLMAEDLPRVRLWVGNALRGMSGAVWVG
ncbi:MAG: aminotransferase class IV [Pseudotabrizicola sp.]|uniref:aminotransferase class IV n=1 Tax=Pseudotabrizicola sp. TaxID=2939647 RepID=UPI002727209A|nr:aminotransferase class IV [Pseudotabrizicola sp.]MDO8885131.1 aminotransferase class IV [Pseudotabrizicola sp.]MDP2080757.1 aminotransferase class IV [Pseudotabrizicola sp.]MDZ7574657.1 aminotransferase class IV [Pseudotabrizicola sp.]